MKPVILQAWTLYRYVLATQLKNWFFYFFIIYAIVTLFGVRWDPDYQKVFFLGLNVGRIGDLREYALQDTFVDLHKLIWLLALFIFIPFHVLFRLSNSHTVSNTLWLRLSPMSYTSITLFRCFIVVGITLLLFLASLLWASLFAAIHHLSLQLLVQPLVCLLAFMLFTGGLMIWLSPGATAPVEFRYGLVVAVSAVPFILHMFRNNLSRYFGDYIPYLYTYNSISLNSSTLKASLTAIALGILLLFAKVAASHWQQQSTIKHLKP